MNTNRRNFLKNISAVSAGLVIAPQLFAEEFASKKRFEISLAQWSLHKAFFSKKIDTLDFPAIARKQFGIGAVEYVNQFFKDKVSDEKYLQQLLSRSKDNGVTNHLIMIDEEGNLGTVDDKERMKSVENHYKWVNAAKLLGCQTIRVNAYGKGQRTEVQKAAIDGLSRLAEYAEKVNLNVIVENHGSYSSDGKWLLETIKQVNKKNVGILPDFGNFCIERESGDLYQGKCINEYDKYDAVKDWMPYAKGVSAKTFNFNEKGDCIETDYKKMFNIIKASNFKGYIGIEYEGDTLSEEAGIKATKVLLKRTLGKMV